MSENTLRIIGSKANKVKRTLNFVVLCNKAGYVWNAEVTVEDMNTAFKNVSRTIFLLNNFVWNRLESYDYEYLMKIQEEINAYLYQLRYREDVLCHPIIQELFSVPYAPLPIELMSSIKISDTYSVTSAKFVPNTQAIITSCQYSSIFKGIGKLWSLIESQFYGQIGIFGFDDSLFKIELNDTKEQIRSSYFKPNTFEAIYGLENGSLLVVRFKMKLGPNSKGIYDGEKLNFSNKTLFKVHANPVIAITSNEDLLLTISTDSILKVSICKWDNGELVNEVIGGGSLKQRLTSCDSEGKVKSGGKDKLISLFYDPVTKKVFLGSDLGKVLVYLLENSIPKYQYTVACGESIWDLQVSLGCMYLAVGDCIAVYSDTRAYEILARFRPHVEGCRITCLRYLLSKEQVFAGYSVILT